MAITVPKIRTQYITLFDDEESYNAAKGDFIEVNWSAVKDEVHPEAVITPYQPSTRTTHGFEPVDGDTVKPDSDVRMFYYTFDHIFKTFFLEIIWGYSGWEWKDYEFTDPDTSETVTLKGGNLYKVKEITEVPSIPDGYRLQHINNFLNSQDKVTHICWFDTSNIVSMRGAFTKSAYGSSTLKRIMLDCYDFPNVKDISSAFRYTRLKIIDDHTLYLGKVTSVTDSDNSNSAFSNITLDDPNHMLTVNMPQLLNADYLLYSLSLPTKGIAELDLNNMFVGETLKKCSSFSWCLAFMNSSLDEGVFTVKLDLTNSSLNSNVPFVLDRFLSSAHAGSYIPIKFDLRINNPVNLDLVLGGGNSNYPAILTINNPNLVTSIVLGFNSRCWNQDLVFPYSQPLNETLDDTEEFKGAYFNCDVDYDFSPNHTLKLSYGHFDDAHFRSGTHVFRNMEYLNRVIFSPSEGFSTLPNTLWSPNIQYEFPTTYTKTEYMGDSRFKIIKIGGSVKNIAPQTLYCLNEDIFTNSDMNLDNDIIIHCCQHSMKGSQYSSLEFTSNAMVRSPKIYVHIFAFDSNSPASARIGLNGALLEEVEIHIVNETGENIIPWLDLGRVFSNTPKLRKVTVDSNFAGRDEWNISNCPDMIMSSFETLLMQKEHTNIPAGVQLGSLKLLTSQWNALSASCKEHCLEIFSYIDQVAE